MKVEVFEKLLVPGEPRCQIGIDERNTSYGAAFILKHDEWLPGLHMVRGEHARRQSITNRSTPAGMACVFLNPQCVRPFGIRFACQSALLGNPTFPGKENETRMWRCG